MHVTVNHTFFRSEESVPPGGNPAKKKSALGWQHGRRFEQMIHEMVDHGLQLVDGA